MRQYGAIRGNAFESEREFLAFKGRAVEKKFAEDTIAEELDTSEDIDDSCDICRSWKDDVCPYCKGYSEWI